MVCTSRVAVPPDYRSPTPSTSSAMKTPGITQEDPEVPGPADEEDIQMEYSYDKLCRPSILYTNSNK
jgi:hypothetical protein